MESEVKRERELVLIIGGARSGKSRHALQLAQRFNRKAYLATGVATDDEMKQRIARHQKERGPDWQTIEQPLELSSWLDRETNHFDVVLIDCLSFWISNLLWEHRNEQAVATEITEFAVCLRRCNCAVLVVSNEVGLGVVPDNSLGRQFRDLVGLANQQIAGLADRVLFMVAGLPLQVK